MTWMILTAAFGALRRHLLRSALIAITVAIGISAVVTTVSLTDGLKTHVRVDSSKAGRAVSAVHRPIFQILSVLAGGPKPKRRLALYYEDLAAITRELPTATVVRRVGGEKQTEEKPVTFVPTEIGFANVHLEDGRDAKTVVVGTVPDYRVTTSYGLAAGRYLSAADIAERNAVCVLDGGRARDFWGATVEPESCLGRVLELSYGGTKHSLEVIGVLEEPFLLREKFKAFDTGRHARPAICDRLNLMNIYAPITTLMNEVPEAGADTVQIAGVRFPRRGASSGMLIYYGDCKNRDIERYEDRLKGWARERNLAVFILPQWYWLGLITELIGEADIVGGLIWLVILGVTIVMILIINLVVVRERFREVAIRRTEGARRADILWQFIMESCVLSMAGGGLGLLGGVLGAKLLSKHVTEWPPEFNPGNFGLALLAALAVGVLSTSLPAWQAARLDPVKVLAKS